MQRNLGCRTDLPGDFAFFAASRFATYSSAIVRIHPGLELEQRRGERARESDLLLGAKQARC
eukprot:5708065-Prorocentrum_lima.AAC.1